MDRGSMGLLLKISRLVGLAPIKYAPEFQVSRGLVICGRVFMIFNGLLGMASMAGYLTLIYFQGITADRAIKACYFFLLLTTSSIGVFTAPARLTKMDNYFKSLNQIDVNLQDILKTNTLNQSNYKTLILFGGYFILPVIDLGRNFLKSNASYVMVIKKIISSSFVLNLYIWTLLQLQIIFFVQRVNITLNAINNILQKLLFDAVSDSRAISDHVPRRKIDNEESMPHKIRQIATSYRFICQVVLMTTRTHGAIMILALLCMIFHLEIHLHPIVASVVSNTSLTDIMTFKNVSLFLWSVCCLFFIVYYIEKFHQTHYEMQRTHNLIVHRQSKEYEIEVEHELELFYRILILCDVSYSPLSMCTIDRPLMIKLFGCLMTYMVIILQYVPETQHSTLIDINGTSLV